jgi:pSer/pThr/pTyr-binding forkhead associated (FHA) protein
VCGRAAAAAVRLAPLKLSCAAADRGAANSRREARLLVNRAVLRIQAQDGTSREHTIAAEQTLIGRSVQSDVRLADSGISREHAVITWDGERYTIEDLQSTNGTRVNGKRVRSAELAADDRIQMGRTTLVFRLDG